MRLVAYIQADLTPARRWIPLLPEVAWSWLVDALDARAEHVTALGGTVTATTSVRYGDISGPPRAHQLEAGVLDGDQPTLGPTSRRSARFSSMPRACPGGRDRPQFTRSRA